MTKRPYSFPLRSRAAMTSYITDRNKYIDHYTPFPFSWKVKAYNVDFENPRGEPHDSSLDAKWSAYIARNGYLWESAVEDAQRDYSEGDYTTYPGDDQGDWQFGFYGRQGGHICLEKWRGRQMYGRDFDLNEFVTALSFADVRTLYRALVCMDSDFTCAKASENVEYHLAFQRSLWEEREHEKTTHAARCLEASRPDMYR